MSAVAAMVLLMSGAGCAPTILRSGEHAAMEELWVEPGPARRNLWDGPGGAGQSRPERDDRYEVLDEDRGGFSITYRVRDRQGVEWRVKIGPEAAPEVISGRIVWALGYHQLPSYFVSRWIAVQHGRGRLLGGARFRPADLPLDDRGGWSWHRNPFVGTTPYQGLLALMLMLNNTDLKADNNEIYERESSDAQARRRQVDRWYVVKDLGASLGETGRLDPRRGYIDGFEREPFIVSATRRGLTFGFRGRHQELLKGIRVEHVRWIAARVLRLTDRQLRDAFAAGGMPDARSTRYIARLREKARQGLALP